jgi:thiol:disulfide interchange protein
MATVQNGLIGLAAIAVGFAGVMAFRSFAGGGVAAMPAAFDASRTSETALAESAETGRPVVFVATADWCGPCQTLKKNALSDPAIVRTLTEDAIAVSLNDATDREAIASLGVRAYPTTLVVRNGEVVDRLEGNVSVTRYAAFLESAFQKSP